MREKKPLSVSLTDEQRKLVRDNMGLVAVHLRRYVANLSTPRREREWEDLFQEGCMGLIRAAMIYRQTSGIAFAAFALPRIHNAVSRALQRKFTTIIVPPKRTKPADKHQPGTSKKDDRPRPREYSLGTEVDQTLEDRRRHCPDRKDTGETVGERLRGKYERAVSEAAETISRRSSTRGDRDELVRWIIQERLLIPHEESRRALRQIARDTKSSYARVAQCDKQLSQIVRNFLEEDPEFCELQRRRRNDEEGMDRSIDREMETRLRYACEREYVRRYHKADNKNQAQMLHAVIDAAREGVEVIIHHLFSELTTQEREKLFRITSPSANRTTSKSVAGRSKS